MWKNFLFFSNPRRPPEVKGPKSAKFDPTNHISAWHLDLVHPFWTIFDMNILLDPRNKPVEFIFDFLKIQDGHRRSKIEVQHNYGSKSHFGLANGFRSFDLDKIWQEDTSQTQEQDYGRFFYLSQNPRDPVFSQTHVFKDKECNEGIICVLRPLQLPQNQSKIAAIWVKVGVLRLNTYSRGVILLWEILIYGSINYWFKYLHKTAFFFSY